MPAGGSARVGLPSKEECAKRAVALLQQAIAKGYKNLEHVTKDDDLKALRERADFKKLLAELDAMIKTPAPKKSNAPSDKPATPLPKKEPDHRSNPEQPPELVPPPKEINRQLNWAQKNP